RAVRCALRCLRLRLETENADSVVPKQLLRLRFVQTDFLDELEAGPGIPARIVRAVHDPVDAVELDGEPDARGMWRYGIGVHAPDVAAGGLRQLRVMAVLVHSAGLIRQGTPGVGHDDPQ